eukprot:215175_1
MCTPAPTFVGWNDYYGYDYGYDYGYEPGTTPPGCDPDNVEGNYERITGSYAHNDQLCCRISRPSNTDKCKIMVEFIDGSGRLDAYGQWDGSHPTSNGDEGTGWVLFDLHSRHTFRWSCNKLYQLMMDCNMICLK